MRDLTKVKTLKGYYKEAQKWENAAEIEILSNYWQMDIFCSPQAMNDEKVIRISQDFKETEFSKQ